MPLNSVAPASAAANPAANISQQDFMKILLTQLTTQDPLKPMDNTAFVAQLAQFTQLAQTQELTASANQLLAVQTASQTMAMLGRTVSIGAGNTFTNGLVTDISFAGNAPTLTVHPASGPDQTGVGLSQVSGIR